MPSERIDPPTDSQGLARVPTPEQESARYAGSSPEPAPAPGIEPSGVAMWERTVPHDPANVAAVLRELADTIEQADGRAVLIMLASTGFGEPWEAHIQAVLDWGEP